MQLVLCLTNTFASHNTFCVAFFLVVVIFPNATIVSKHDNPCNYRHQIGSSTVVVSSLSDINSVLRDSIAFRSHAAFDAFQIMFGNDVVLLLDGTAHAQARGQMTPAFAQSLLSYHCAFVPRYAEQFWRGLAEDVRTRKLHFPIKLDPLFRKLTFSLIVALTAGIDERNEPELVEYMRKNFLDMSRGLFAPKLPFGPWQKALQGRDRLMDCICNKTEEVLERDAEIIEKLRALPADRLATEAKSLLKSGAVDIFAVLLAQTRLVHGQNDTAERGAELERFAQNIKLFWFAGYDTSASTLSSAVFELWRNPDVLQQLRTEQDNLVVNTGPTPSVPGIMSEMPLLDAFVTETLRLHPPAPGAFRKVVKNGTILGGYTVNEGQQVLLDFCESMRDPAVYPNPDVIDLTRYSADVAGKRKAAVAKSLMTAFGTGPHRCIGYGLAEVIIKTVLAVLLRGYEFDLDKGQSVSYSVIPNHTPVSKVPLTNLERRELSM